MAEKVEVIIDADDKASGPIKDIGGALEGLGKVAKGAAIATGAIAAGIGAAAGALIGVGAIAKDFVMAASESEEVATRMEAQLAALGDTANVSANDINNLADKLSKISGFDDEDLIAAQATLLRFGNLSKEQFEKASTAATDLAAITGMDVKTAFQQLGVALDNPELGFGRLKRQIGDLTDAQKEEIKVAMEAGDVAKAQGIILDALAAKTKGAAEKMGNTLQGSMNKMRVAFSNVKEDVGAVMLPFVKTMFKKFADTVIDAFENIVEFFKSTRFQDMLRRLTDWFGRLMDSVKRFFRGEFIGTLFYKIADILETKVIPSISEFAQRVGGTLRIALRALWSFISTFVIPILRRLWLWIQANLPPAIKAVANFFNNVFLPAIRDAFNWIEANVFPIIRRLWDWLQQKIPEAIFALRMFWYNQFLPAVKAVWEWVQANVFPIAQKLWDWLMTNIPAAIQSLSGFWNTTLLPAIRGVGDWIKNQFIPALQDTYDWFKTKLPEAIKTYKDELKLLEDTYKSLQDVMALFNSDSKKTSDGFKIDWAATFAWISAKVSAGFAFLLAQVNAFQILARDALDILKALFSGKWWELLAALIQFGEDFRIQAVEVLKKFVGVFTDKVKWPDLKPMGRAMIDGLIAGWKESWGTFWTLVDGDFNRLLALIAAKLLIHSPSQVFADQIGKPMAQGVQVGWGKQMGLSSKTIGNSLMPGGYSSGGGSIVINYAPMISTGSTAEFESQFVPLVDQAMRRVKRGKV